LVVHALKAVCSALHYKHPGPPEALDENGCLREQSLELCLGAADAACIKKKGTCRSAVCARVY